MTHRQRILKHIPKVLLFQPFELLFSISYIFSALAALLYPVHSLSEIFPTWLVIARSLTLVFGALCVIIGLVKINSVVEKLGIRLLVISLVAYGVVAATAMSTVGPFIVLVYFVSAFAWMMRLYIITTSQDIVRENIRRGII